MSPASEPLYDASKLQLVEGLDHVRKRPGMYIGSTGPKGLHHCIEEIVSNSVDEFMAGHGNKVVVEVMEDGWVRVQDFARGIPIDVHEETGLSGLELVLTRLGGGGKWNAEDGGYKVSGGLHGVGSSVVNAVSSEMRAKVCRDGYEFSQTYHRGVPTGPVTKGKKSASTGTEISWHFDQEIFESGVKYERETVERRLRELSYLNPGLEFVLRFPGYKEEAFHAEGGLSDYMKHLVVGREGILAVHKQPVMLSGEVVDEIDIGEGKTRSETTYIDVALYWTTSQNESWHAFVNSINTYEGGTHYDGLRSGLRKALNEVGQEMNKFRAKDTPFEQVDTREGLFCAVAVKVGEPQFEGQTKIKLGNPDVQRRVDNFVATQLKSFLLDKKNKGEAERIIDRVIEARDGRLAAKKAKDAVQQRKGLLGASGLPGKLADCTAKSGETEIFIVEGDSAGGGMKQKRDRVTQAVLPLRGKIQNAEKAGPATLNSEAIKDILAALGGTITNVKVPVQKGNKVINKNRLFVDLSEPRYSRVIITTDADVDGGHITTLLLTFFLRFAPSLIREGRLYVAELPLYRIEHKKEGRLYLYSDEQLGDYAKKDEIKKRVDGTVDVQRFKGLGEMMPEQLRELALDPQTRRIHRVVIDDLSEADDMTSLLMGSRVDRRRQYIEEHAGDVEVDI